MMRKVEEVLLKEKYLLDKTKLLGRGTFAKVYEARNLKTNETVAIKAINVNRRDNNARDDELVNLVKREITIMRRLKHPNIVELYDVIYPRAENENDKFYLVMEYAKGGGLFDKLARGKLEEKEAWSYFQQLITAVDFCHKNGVYHRDLKPENLLLDENGVLKVLDFGLSAFVESKQGDVLPDTLCGTPGYTAPEVICRTAYNGAKADIWSCGVILFVLLAGQVPFDSPSVIGLRRKICRARYICPRWFPVEVRSLLRTCWFKTTPVVANASSDECDNSESQDLALPTSLNPINTALSSFFKIYLVRLVSLCSPKLLQATLS